MTCSSQPQKLAFALIAVFASALLASCQTSADEVLSIGDATPSEEVSASAPGGKSFRDPYVVAVSGQPAAAAMPAASQNETDPPRLKRKPVPLAAAFADIAEPPPEVLALQQQAAQGQAQPAGQPQAQAQPDLGDITMQPTAVNAGNSSLFSAGRANQPSAAQTGDMGTAQVAAAGSAASPSLVPGDMPTLGVNAMRKSLFSPSAEQQALMQQQGLQAQTPQPTAEGLPLTESTTAPAEEQPVLMKLSDPRPKRKILALREPTSAVPERVQLTPDQLQAMGAVQEFDPAEPLPADEQVVAEADAGPKKMSWLPSLSNLLKGGKKAEKAAAAP